MGYQKNELVVVTIEDIGSEGEGIGKVDGFTLFVKDAVVGDRVEARIVKSKKNYAYARLEKVLEPSPFRVKPECACHRQCGGCQLQALSYEKQLAFKQDKIRNSLIRIGGFAPEEIDGRMEPVVGMDVPLRYRNKAQYPVGTDREGNVVAGFYAGRTHSIISNADCLLGPVEYGDIMGRILEYMRENQVSAYDETTGTGLVRHVLIRKGFASGEIMVCLVINRNMTCVSDDAREGMDGFGRRGRRGRGEGAGCRRVGYAADEADGWKARYVVGEVSGQRAGCAEKGAGCRRAGCAAGGADGWKAGYVVGEVNGQRAGCAEKGAGCRRAGCAAGETTDRRTRCAVGERVVQAVEGEFLPKQQDLLRRLTQIDGMASISVSIQSQRTNVIMGQEVHTIWGQDVISDKIRVRDMGRSGWPYTGEALTFHISPLSFYQVNPVQTEKLYSLALEYAGLTGQETVWDLYCGIGTISLFLAVKAKQVYGVEIVPQAIADARENAARNGIRNAAFFVGKAEEVLGRFCQGEGAESNEGNSGEGERCCLAAMEESGNPKAAGREGSISVPGTMRHPDVVVVDPPRKGCAPDCLNAILAAGPDRVVYVSCDPATLARDLRVLCDGGYEIRRIRGVDMFGMTVHVETVCLLSKLNLEHHY